jgi:hypothetical protein
MPENYFALARAVEDMRLAAFYREYAGRMLNDVADCLRVAGIMRDEGDTVAARLCVDKALALAPESVEAKTMSAALQAPRSTAGDANLLNKGDKR